MLLTQYDEKKIMRMTYQEGVEEGHIQGLAQGTDRVNQLIRLLAGQSRTDDIIKAASDKAYQEKLFEEFHI